MSCSTYSPEAVAEHAMAMILTLNRKTHKAYNQWNKIFIKGLLGFDLHGKTVGSWNGKYR
jgi:D-lactate dehydrogenase